MLARSDLRHELTQSRVYHGIGPHVVYSRRYHSPPTPRCGAAAKNDVAHFGRFVEDSSNQQSCDPPLKYTGDTNPLEKLLHDSWCASTPLARASDDREYSATQI